MADSCRSAERALIRVAPFIRGSAQVIICSRIEIPVFKEVNIVIEKIVYVRSAV